MTEDRLSRLGPLSGVLFVVLELAGAAIAGASGRAMVTLGDPTSTILNAFADPVRGAASGSARTSSSRRSRPSPCSRVGSSAPGAARSPPPGCSQQACTSR